MNTEKIIPVGEFILIGLETEDTQENQLILNIQEDIENKGVVKAVGEKVNTDEYSIKIEKGDKIIFTVISSWDNCITDSKACEYGPCPTSCNNAAHKNTICLYSSNTSIPSTFCKTKLAIWYAPKEWVNLVCSAVWNTIDTPDNCLILLNLCISLESIKSLIIL